MSTIATTTRPFQADDLDRLLALQHAHQRAVLGRPDATRDDVRDELADPDRDPASPVVVDDEGRALGSALVVHDGSSDHADIDVVVDPDRGVHLLAGLITEAVRLAADGARRRGHAQVTLDQGCYRGDVVLAESLAAAGFTPATAYYRMRRELDQPVEVVLPAGVVVERVDVDTDEALRRAHRLHTSTFEGHFGFTARPYEQWLAAHRARTGSGPLWFATVDGVDAGFLHETSQFEQDENAGYVLRLGVERAARGRGVAKALLLSAFAGMRERGRAAALLHVDSANATGATQLYESVGMRAVVVIDMWRHTVPTDG